MTQRSGRGALSILLVEDEAWARRELRDMLSRVEGIGTVEEAACVDEAVLRIRETSPDAVLLDIHLAGEEGFDLLPHLPDGVEVVFVTAYDEHAVRAFEVNAIDYLLKPVRMDRLRTALERVRRAREPTSATASGPRTAAEETTRHLRELAEEDYVYLPIRGGQFTFLRVSEISFVRARGDYSEVGSRNGRTCLVERPLREWQLRLPDRRFVRTHRAAIVNLRHVERVEHLDNRTGRVYVHGREEPLPMSRRRAARIRRRFG